MEPPRMLHTIIRKLRWVINHTLTLRELPGRPATGPARRQGERSGQTCEGVSMWDRRTTAAIVHNGDVVRSAAC